MKTKTQVIPKKLLKSKVNTNFDITDFELFRDLVLIRAIRPESNNGLSDPETYESKPEFGEIIKVGEELIDKVKVGMICRFGKYSTESIRTNGQDYFLVHFEDLSGYLPK